MIKIKENEVKKTATETYQILIIMYNRLYIFNYFIISSIYKNMLFKKNIINGAEEKILLKKPHFLSRCIQINMENKFNRTKNSN